MSNMRQDNRPQGAAYLTHGSLSALAGIRHGFFTRQGGVSTDIYASLNCGVGSKDDQGLVRENRARVTAALGVPDDRLATPYQVHGTNVIVVETAWETGKGPKADAVVTNRPGIAVGVGTADCGPIVLADGRAGVVGAAHAGWRGALAGITDAAVAAMERLGARREDIVAVLGPAISQANYEVGAELVDRFTDDDAGNARFFLPSLRPGHAMFDLPGYIVARLEAAGVTAAAIGLCTYADPHRFYSYRRATHRGEPDYGRLLSAVVIAGD
jgi:purine-nucleoside/S-methyl-5'-thioadenosine phosphorylase / adenosine deaminase